MKPKIPSSQKTVPLTKEELHEFWLMIENKKFPRHMLLPDLHAAQIARLSKRTFQTWRSQKKGPPYVEFEGTIRYPLGSLVDWLFSNMVHPEDVAV